MSTVKAGHGLKSVGSRGAPGWFAQLVCGGHAMGGAGQEESLGPWIQWLLMVMLTFPVFEKGRDSSKTVGEETEAPR